MKPEFCIDKISILPEKEVAIEGWMFKHKESDRILFSINNEKFEIESNNFRQDVVNAYSNEGLNNELLVGFSYKFVYKEEIAFLKLELKSEDNGSYLVFEANENEVKKYIDKSTIKYNIDSIKEIKKKEIEVIGWVFSTYTDFVSITSSAELVEDVIRQHRLDVQIAYGREELNEQLGFRILFRSKRFPIEINFSDGLNEVCFPIKKEMAGRKKGLLSIIFSNLSLNNIIRSLRYIKKNGWRAFLNKIQGKENKAMGYEEWQEKHCITAKELNKQRSHRFNYEPLVSIIVPTFNTPELFLREMIESVLKQSYQKFELCIADGSDSGKTKKILEDYQKDKRIKIEFLNKNLGIAGNTNHAMNLAVGDYIGLLDHDDVLAPNALYEIVKVINEKEKPDYIYTDEDKIDEIGSVRFDPHFKPDYSPDTLRSYNYICHFSVFKRSLMEKIGEFRSVFDGSQDYDYILRLTENANEVVHISKILYHWRAHRQSVASDASAKPYTINAAKAALAEHLKRKKLKGEVIDGQILGTYKINYEIEGRPLISIIIPNKDNKELLEKCIESIRDKTEYNNYEIIIVDNNSCDKALLSYYDTLRGDSKIKIYEWGHPFNYSAINNFAVKKAKGEYLVLLNNDIEILSGNWLEEFLMLCQRKDVGIVGAKLYYPNDTIQHAGVILGIGGVAGHSHKYYSRKETGYFGRLSIVQNLSAVTAACLMVKKEVYREVEGLDETFAVAFNDVDFCMKVRQQGYLVLYTPYVEAYHYESKTRGTEDTPEKQERFFNERKRFEEKWGLYLKDPYYNENLSLEKEDFSLKNLERDGSLD